MQVVSHSLMMAGTYLLKLLIDMCFTNKTVNKCKVDLNSNFNRK